MLPRLQLSADEHLSQLKQRGARALAAQLVMPALDLRPGEQPAFEVAMSQLSELPLNGFLLFGGETSQIQRITRSLRRVAQQQNHPRPLFTCDVERGLGQIVAGGAIYPPFEALQHAQDPEQASFDMGRAIAVESLAVGIDWLYSPVLDLADVEANPIVGCRAFHSEPELVSRLGAAFVKGIQSTGAMACGKHFPGHGGTLADSHDTLPTVAHSRKRLVERDLKPFEACFAEGLKSIMTAHVAYPTLGHPQGLPATIDSALITGRLREQMGYDGLVVTDAFIMDGLREACGGDESLAAVKSLEAGCDIVLYPSDPMALIDDLARVIEERGSDWIEPSLRRILRSKEDLPEIADEVGSVHLDSREDAISVVRDCLQKPEAEALKDFAAQAAKKARVIIVDDDSQDGAAMTFVSELRLRVEELFVSTVDANDSGLFRGSLLAQLQRDADDVAHIFVLRCSIKAWKGRPGLHSDLAAFLKSLMSWNEGRRASLLVSLAGAKVLAPLALDSTKLVQVFGEGPACEQAAVEALFGS